MKKIFFTLDKKDQIIFLFETWLIITTCFLWIFIVKNNIKPTEFSNRICYAYYHGYFCPGCGGTRAIESLLYGHIVQSILYHPIIIYVFSIFIISYVSYIIYFITRGNKLVFQIKIIHIMYGIIIIMLWFLIRNYLAFYFNYNIYQLFGLKY